MNKLLPAILLLSFFSLPAAPAPAVDFWQYPEAADKGSVFASAFAASLEIASPGIDGLEFSFSAPEFCLDYVLPIGLPFSFGASFQAESGFFAFGLRPAYHANLDFDWLNFYFMYPISFVLSGEAWTAKYGVGFGARARIKNFFFLAAEFRPSLKGLLFGASFKLN